MNEIWHIFRIISETSLDRFVLSEGGQARAVRGVGNVRFQLSHGGYIDQDGALFVPRMRVNFLSVSALKMQGIQHCSRGDMCRFFQIYMIWDMFLYTRREQD